MKKKRNKDKNAQKSQKSQILPCSVFKENTGTKKQHQ